MLKRYIPWKFLIKRAARAYGIIDPLTFLARIRQFSQPSEVQEPIELVRAGIAFHTRGLINTKAIQHNLDWIWPYWVERQFNPNDNSFIPRAFSFSHVNLTHRNWTAVGHPDLCTYPIVDPRGLITPLYDGWSLDLWLVSDSGEKLLPSRLENVHQQWILTPNLAVKTRCSSGAMQLDSVVKMEIQDHLPITEVQVTGGCSEDGWLIIALRPYNPEGIQFIETVSATTDQPGWLINGSTAVSFDVKPEKLLFSNYEEGDVIHKLNSAADDSEIACDVGMATAAALFRVEKDNSRTIQATIPLQEDIKEFHLSGKKMHSPQPAAASWREALAPTAKLNIPDTTTQFLYDAAIRTLTLLSAEDIVPGPYTYKRFWFRDACLMLNALLAAGMTERAFAILNTFPDRQKISGYFQSQEGEWDSNGQVLWILDRYQRMTNHTFDKRWMKAVCKGAEWIIGKRLKDKKVTPHKGLLPPGFSAEHLGPNDYYYWDDFWGLAGLRSAARLAGLFSSDKLQQKYTHEARDFEKHIFASIALISEHRSLGGIPASPYRRMDAGAIGSMVADYPLHITPKGDKRISKTADFLLANCLHKGAFFQDMIHSGMNIYLTLAIAQTLLRNDDDRYRELLQTVINLASPTGQWPEAIHPLTDGGCMGDGQHGWAAAEWIMMIRNFFVREEGDGLIVGSGILPQWQGGAEPLHFGPAPTLFGVADVHLNTKEGDAVLEFSLDSSGAASPPESIIISVPGYKKIETREIDRQQFRLLEL